MTYRQLSRMQVYSCCNLDSERKEERDNEYHQDAEEQLERCADFYVVHECILSCRHHQCVWRCGEWRHEAE